jgi:hypothetical protein
VDFPQNVIGLLIVGTSETPKSGLGITDLPDPEGLYSSVVGSADFSRTYVDVPNIRDGNGVLITPAEYQTKLETGMVVMVTGHLKL